MSSDTKIQASFVDDGYTVKRIAGCRVVFGKVPLFDMEILTHGFSKKALMAVDIADRIGATVVIGEPEAINNLRLMDLPVSEKRQQDYQSAHGLNRADVARWLRDGERGASSNAMCKRIFGVPNNAGKNHPYDPDDLRRCMLFLDATGAHAQVGLMADVSEEWARLVEFWEQLISLLRKEIADGKSAAKTYALMQKVLTKLAQA